MNLFYLDENHDLNAQYHVDKHVVKMILEAAEMLSMAHIVSQAVGYVPRKLTTEEYKECLKFKSPLKELVPADRGIPYIGRDSHLNHPSTIWVRSSAENYAWTFCYMDALEHERRYRNPRGVPVHTAFKLMCKLGEPNIPDVGFTKFALAMKVMKDQYPQYYNEDDPIQSYRYFYMLDKAKFASWNGRDKPHWWNEEIANYGNRL